MALAMWVLLSLAAWGADLTGTWAYDAKASESTKPILKARGAPWHVRTAVGLMSRTLTFSEERDQKIETVADMGVARLAQTLTLDDQPREETTPKGDVATVRSRREGDAVVTQTSLALRDGTPGVLTTTRTVVEGALHVRLVLTDASGGVVAAATERYTRVDP